MLVLCWDNSLDVGRKERKVSGVKGNFWRRNWFRDVSRQYARQLMEDAAGTKGSLAGHQSIQYSLFCLNRLASYS